MSGNRFKFWLVVIGLAAGAAYSFWFAFKAWAKNRLIEDTPTSRVRSAAQGYVELSGEGLLPADSHNKGPLNEGDFAGTAIDRRPGSRPAGAVSA